MKSTAFLIVGVLLLVGGIAGGAIALLGGPASKLVLTPAELAAERERLAEETRIAAEEERAREIRRQRRQDNDDIREIVAAKVAETPHSIDDGWFDGIFRYIPNEDSLKSFHQDLLARGAEYDAIYSADFAARSQGRKVQSNDPRFYINTKAGEIIPAPSPRKLRVQAKGCRDRGVYREYRLKEEAWENIRPEIISIYYQMSVKRLRALVEIERKKGRSGEAERRELLRIREAIAMDRYLKIKAGTAAAVERFSKTTSSAAGATNRINQWHKTLKEQLLEVGRIYVNAADAEKRYYGKRQEDASKAFKALAMVHRLTASGDALQLIIKVNRIQRDYLWRVAKLHWKRAKKADDSGDLALAGEEYLQAKRRYLQALSRIEGSKQKYLYKELRVLQGDIRDWYQARYPEGISSSRES